VGGLWVVPLAQHGYAVIPNSLPKGILPALHIRMDMDAAATAAAVTARNCEEAELRAALGAASSLPAGVDFFKNVLHALFEREGYPDWMVCKCITVVVKAVQVASANRAAYGVGAGAGTGAPAAPMTFEECLDASYAKKAFLRDSHAICKVGSEPALNSQWARRRRWY
jgi:hypothetical protein